MTEQSDSKDERPPGGGAESVRELRNGPAQALTELACALEARGVRPVICKPSGDEPAVLQLGEEVIQATEIDGRRLLVTESGRVLGFGDDPEIAEEILDHYTEPIASRTCSLRWAPRRR